MLGLLAVGSMYYMRESGVFDKPENEIAIIPIYGSEIVQKARMISERFDCDPILIKLVLVAMAFSSNCFIQQNRTNTDQDSLLLGTFRLFGSQNVYVELIWKYLVDRYSYDGAVKQYSTLVKRLLEVLKFSIEIYENNQIFQKFIDDSAGEVERFPIVDGRSIIPLWGKK